MRHCELNICIKIGGQSRSMSFKTFTGRKELVRSRFLSTFCFILWHTFSIYLTWELQVQQAGDLTFTHNVVKCWPRLLKLLSKKFLWLSILGQGTQSRKRSRLRDETMRQLSATLGPDTGVSELGGGCTNPQHPLKCHFWDITISE